MPASHASSWSVILSAFMNASSKRVAVEVISFSFRSPPSSSAAPADLRRQGARQSYQSGFLLLSLLWIWSHGCRGFRFGRTGLIFFSQLEQCLGCVLVQYCASQSAVSFRLLQEELCPLIDQEQSLYCCAASICCQCAAIARACGEVRCGAVSVGGKSTIWARSFWRPAALSR